MIFGNVVGALFDIERTNDRTMWKWYENTLKIDMSFSRECEMRFK